MKLNEVFIETNLLHFVFFPTSLHDYPNIILIKTIDEYWLFLSMLSAGNSPDLSNQASHRHSIPCRNISFICFWKKQNR